MFSQRSSVSVAITTYNESDSIISLLESLVAQTTPPDEVIICDASTDDTAARIQSFAEKNPTPIRVIVRPGANISKGRNVAIEAAKGDIIAVTDAGVKLDPQWLEKITAPFENPQVHAVAGFFTIAPQTPFEVAVGATLFPLLNEIAPAKFLPSSRSVAFCKSVWETVGGYPEWLDYSEDIVLDQLIRGHFGNGQQAFVFEPEAVVAYKPWPNLKSMRKAYRQYARGDGKAGLNWHEQHLRRYVAFSVGIGSIILAALFERLVWPSLPLPQHPLISIGMYLVSLIPLAGVIALRLWSPYRRLVQMWGGMTLGQKLPTALWVPIVRFAGEIAKMRGYPAGVLWRWKNRHRDEIHWKKNLPADLQPGSSGPSRLLF